MTSKLLTILWVTIIITVAYLLSGLDLNAGTSFGIVGGLSGAAIGSIQAHAGRKSRCA